MIVGEAKTDVYSYKTPQINLVYCPIVSYEVVESKKNGIIYPGAALLAVSCGSTPTSPCPIVDIKENMALDVISFHIKMTVKGGGQLNSDIIQLLLTCEGS